MLQEAFVFAGITSPATTQGFTLTLGGRYLCAVNGTFNSSTVKLQTLGPDGTNYLDIFSAYDVSAAEQDEPINSWSAAEAKILDLAPGTYQFKLGTNSGMTINASVARVPLA